MQQSASGHSPNSTQRLSADGMGVNISFNCHFSPIGLVPQLNRCQSSNICQNGGTCLNSYCSFDDRVDFFCDCPIGFIGEVCTIPCKYQHLCSRVR